MPDGRLRRSNAWTLDGSETSAAPVSPDACIRLRSNAGGTAIEVSYDQAAYVTLAGSAGKWNAITAPDGNLALSHVAYTTAFTWSATSGTASDLFTLQNTTDDTGTGAILAINTPGGSNAKDPLTITAQTNTRVQVRYNGDLLINRAVTSASGPLIDLRKSRNTLAAPWNVASGDSLGTIGYTAFCGTGGTGSEVQLGSFSLIADRDLTAADYGANFRWQTKDSAESIALRNRMWLTSLGYLGIGQNLAVTDVTQRLTVAGSATAYSDINTTLTMVSGADNPSTVSLESTGGTVASPSASADNYAMGHLKFKARNTAAALKEIASISGVVDGTNVTQTPGALVFYTRLSGEAVLNARFVISGASIAAYVPVLCTATSTLAGLNVGSYAGNPSGPNNGDLWYNSTGNVLNARINGATVSLGAGSGANTALSNLASVSINASLIPQTTLDLGANTTAWRNLYIYGAGTYGSHSFKLHGTPTGHRVLTLPDVTDIVAVLGTSQTFTAPALIFGGTLAQTTANTATSSTQSFFDQNITIAPASSSSAAYRMFDLSVLFTTAQTLSGSVVLYNSSVTHSQNSSLAGYYLHFDTFTKDTANSVSAVTGYDWVASISSGTTSDLTGYIADFTVGASGTATTTIGFTSTLANSGSATTYYAYRAIKSGTITNPYGFGSSVGFLHGLGTLSPAYTMDVQQTTSATATVSTIANFDYVSSGTAAAGFGLSHRYALESSTTASQLAAQMDVRWQSATHASRSAVYSVKTTANAITKERMLLGGYKSLTDATATDIFNVTFAAASQGAAGGIIVITGIVKKADTTDTHAISETVQWTAGHWNGSSSINVGIVTGASRGVGGSGAYGLTYSTTGAGGDTLTFRVAADSTLNVLTELYFQIFYGGDAEVTLA